MDESIHIMIALPLLFIGWYLMGLLPGEQLEQGRVMVAAEIAAREAEGSLRLPLQDSTCGTNAVCIARHDAAITLQDSAARQSGTSAAERRLSLICQDVDVEFHPEPPQRLTGSPQIAALVTCDGVTVSYVYNVP